MKGLVSLCLMMWASVSCFHAAPTVSTVSVVSPDPFPGQSKACANHYCQNGGLCIPYLGDYYHCTCQPGWDGAFCQTDETAGRLESAFTKNGLIPEMCDGAPLHTLKIDYNGNKIDDENIGKTLTPTQVRYQPTKITWPKMSPAHFYTIIMIDPDMPSRDTPIADKTQVLHWIIVNIPGAGVGGRQLAPYIGSGPPPNTGIHRYTFLVFDEGTEPKDYTSVKPFDLIDIGRRVNWNFVEEGKGWTLRGFMEWANMGLPIAGNFYQAEWDAWVDQLWRTFNQFYE